MENHSTNYYVNLYRINNFSEFEKQLISNSETIDIISILLRCPKIEFKPIFWRSQIPVHFCKAIFSSFHSQKFLEAYFRKESHCNILFEKALIEFDILLYVKFFKLFKACFKKVFLRSLNEIADTNDSLDTFSLEVNYIVETQNYLDEIWQEDYIPKIQTIPFDRFLLRFTYHYEKIKQHVDVLQDKNFQYEQQTHLLKQLDFLITSSLQNKVINKNQFSPEIFQREWKIQEPPHKHLGKKISLKTSKFKQDYLVIDKVIEYLDAYVHFKVWSSYYFAEALTLWSKKTPRYIYFKYNDKKHHYEDNYMQDFRELYLEEKVDYNNFFMVSKKAKGISNKILLDVHFPIPKKMIQALTYEHEVRLEITNDINYFEHLNIPLTIPNDENLLSIEKVLTVLKTFSLYKATEGKSFEMEKNNYGKNIPIHYFIRNKPTKDFKKLFGGNTPIACFNEEGFTEKIATYFNWEIDETQNILDFLTTDLNKNNTAKKIAQKPFIKVNDYYYWLGTFYKDMRWQNHIINELFDKNAIIERKTYKEKDIKFKDRYGFPDRFEAKIEQLFKESDFITFRGEYDKNGLRGDIDTLAYKDGYLYIIEAKISSKEEDILNAAYAENIRLEGKAVFQLEKNISYLKENWNDFISTNKLRITENINDIKIVPLIVTNYFNSDLQLNDNELLKTSLLELEVILKNKRKKLLTIKIMDNMHVPFDSFQHVVNANNNTFKHPEIDSNKDYSLWKGKSIPADSLVSILKNNSVWEDIEKTWKIL